MGTNYARETGIRLVSAAIAFACIYTFLLGWYVYMSYKRPVHVHFALVIYCTFTVISISMRAALASSDTYGGIFGLLNAEQIIFSIGFLILLYSSHTLVLDLEQQSVPSDQPVLNNISVRFIGSPRIFHFLLLAAIVLALASGITSNGIGYKTPSEEVHIASGILFFLLTLFQAFQTVMYASMELTKEHRELRTNDPFGKKYATSILLAISLLFLVTEMFAVITIHNYEKGNNEHFLYPFVVVPELFAVVLYATPDLVPAVCTRTLSFSCSKRRNRVIKA